MPNSSARTRSLKEIKTGGFDADGFIVRNGLPASASQDRFGSSNSHLLGGVVKLLAESRRSSNYLQFCIEDGREESLFEESISFRSGRVPIEVGSVLMLLSVRINHPIVDARKVLFW